MLHRIKTWRTAFLYTIIAISAVACTNSEKISADANGTSMEVAKLPVDVIEAEELELNQEEVLVGTIKPYQEVAIVSELSQKITHIAFKDGDFVTKGKLLYKLNDADFKAKLKELHATLKLAKTNEQRYRSLLETETIRQQEYDEQQTNLNALQAQLEFLNYQLSKTEIKAPFSGKIGISKVDVGAFVSPGLELVNLQDQSKVKIHFSVPEKYLSQVKKGKEIQFSTQLSNTPLKATIIASEAGLDSQNRSLIVQAVSNNSKQEFVGGMSAKIHFSTVQDGAKGIKIPSQALIPGANGYNVFLLENDRAKTTSVSISNRTENEVTIVSGVKAGDKVIISNILRLGEGMPVTEVIAN